VNPVSLLAVIQASIAPVVLISGVGLLLLTLSARLGRIVDRTRWSRPSCKLHPRASARRWGIN